MLDNVRALIADVDKTLEFVDTIDSPALRDAIIHAASDTLHVAYELMPKKKRYTLPKPKALPKAMPKAIPKAMPKAMPRDDYTPWTPVRSDLNVFRSEMLSFLRGACPTRNHKANMAEVPKLWNMYKDAGSLKDILECAKAAVIENVGRLRSLSEESI
jgi:hypothetical protein